MPISDHEGDSIVQLVSGTVTARCGNKVFVTGI